MTKLPGEVGDKLIITTDVLKHIPINSIVTIVSIHMQYYYVVESSNMRFMLMPYYAELLSVRRKRIINEIIDE